MKIEINKIKPSDKNPRKIKDERFEKLKESLKNDPAFLDKRPILVDERTMTIYAGNQRWRAAKALGWTEVPVEIDSDDEKIQRKRGLQDNLHMGEFDWDMIANEWDLEELRDAGFDDKELGNLKLDAEEDDFDVDAAIPETPVSKLGDVYQLGDHRLMCGDSTKKEDVEMLMVGEKADMVFTDPPYGMDLDTDYSKLPSTKKEGNKTYSRVIGDNSEFDPIPYLSLANEIILWGADYYADRLPKGGSWFVWDKRVDENFDKMIGSAFELCWSKIKHKREIVRCNNTLFSGEQDAKNKVHPTQKPIKVCVWFIEKLSKSNDLILDLFGGSGSTLIACEQVKRKCRMMELDPKYCDVIIKRWEKLTGKTATKI